MAADALATRILLQVVIIVAAARVGWLLARWTRQPVVLGELLVGVLIGPSLLGLVDSPFSVGGDISAPAEVIAFLAELGAILLLFEVGLESNIKDLARVGRSSALVAVLGVVVSFGLGYGASMGLAVAGVWEDNFVFHVFMGAVFTATSVGITARVLGESGNLGTPEARIILGAAVIDDILALLILAVVASLAAGELSLGVIALKAGLAIGFLVVSLVVGLKAVPWLFDRLEPFGERGVLLPFALLVALVMALLAALAGLAPIIGAFTGGLILAQARAHERIEELVRPVAEAVVPIFFVVTGVIVDVSAFRENAGLVLGVGTLLAVIAILGKLACGWGVRKGEANRLVVGVGMVPRGEVGLIFALFGLTTVGILAWEYAAILFVVLTTTVLVPAWLRRLLPDRRARQQADTLGGTD